MPYLFVHFREKDTEDGEQIYFALSKDGYEWEQVNDGKPVIVATKGDMGVRDIVIIRTENNKFVMMATNLAIVRNIDAKYEKNLRTAFTKGQKNIAMWKSDDLVNWSEEILLDFNIGKKLGCYWAPGIFIDKKSGEYIVHWSSSNENDNYSGLAIYYSKTKDFETFSEPELFYKKLDSEVLDSCICESNGYYHFFVKSADNPKAVIHETSQNLLGPYTRDEAFDRQMDKIELKEKYEAPTVYKLADDKICLMMDFYGSTNKAEQGYVPYVMDSLDNVTLNRSDDKFKFPYKFKHGVVMEITEEEYNRVKKSYNK